MISSTITVIGKMVFQTEMLTLTIITVMSIKVFSEMGKEKDSALMSLIKSTDMKDNGETILSQAKENCSEMENYFFKVNSKMV